MNYILIIVFGWISGFGNLEGHNISLKVEGFSKDGCEVAAIKAKKSDGVATAFCLEVK